MKNFNLIGWMLIAGLFLFYMNVKKKEALEKEKVRVEKVRQDSLAALSRAGAGAGIAGAAAGGTAGRAGLPGSTGPGSPGAGNPALTAGSDSAGTGAAAGGPGGAPALTARTVTLETNQFTVVLDNAGAKVRSLKLKSLAGHKLHQPYLIGGPGEGISGVGGDEAARPGQGGALSLKLGGENLEGRLWTMDMTGGAAGQASGNPAGTDSAAAARAGAAGGPKDSLRVGEGPVEVRFTTALADGKTVVRTYTFYRDSSYFSHKLAVPNFAGPYGLEWKSGLHETEAILEGKGFGILSSFFSELVLDNGAQVLREHFEGRKTFNAESGVLRWVGLRRKYVAVLWNFGRDTNHKVDATGVAVEGRDDTYPKYYRMGLSGANLEEKGLDFRFEVVPLHYEKLLAHHQNYEKIIFSGWEWFLRADIWYVALCGLVLKLLNFFHELIPNYGVAIILLTLLVRIVTFPLTIGQTKSAARMAQHAPAIRQIREKHKGNPQKANLEMMEYYRKNGINPLSGVLGCFPILLQMPIFIALFNVLGRALELKDARFFGWISDLSYPDVILPAFKVPYLFPIGLTVLPFLMALTMYFQMKLTIKDPQQKFMIWMMPIMMFVFSCSFPSGLVLYWTVSNLFTIAQTHFYTNRLNLSGGAGGGAAGPGAGSARAGAKGGNNGASPAAPVGKAPASRKGK